MTGKRLIRNTETNLGDFVSDAYRNVMNAHIGLANGGGIRVNGAYRVKNVLVNGEPPDLSRTYTVASNNYMLKNGGDGYVMSKDNDLIKDCTMLDNKALIEYITKNLGGSVGKEYADPYGQGRITIRITLYSKRRIIFIFSREPCHIYSPFLLL